MFKSVWRTEAERGEPRGRRGWATRATPLIRLEFSARFHPLFFPAPILALSFSSLSAPARSRSLLTAFSMPWFDAFFKLSL